MSHFIAAVITKEPAKYHEDLAPYQENNMGDCPKEFLEFNDLTEEFKKTWREGSAERVRLPNGNLIGPWDERLKTIITKEEYDALPKDARKDYEGWREEDKIYYEYDPSALGVRV